MGAEITSDTLITRDDNGKGTIHFGDSDNTKRSVSDLRALELKPNPFGGHDTLDMSFTDEGRGSKSIGHQLFTVEAGQDVNLLVQTNNELNGSKLETGGVVIFDAPKK